MTETWLVEQLHPYYRKALHYSQKLVDVQSDFQHIEVYQSEFFGKVAGAGWDHPADRTG